MQNDTFLASVSLTKPSQKLLKHVSVIHFFTVELILHGPVRGVARGVERLHGLLYLQPGAARVLQQLLQLHGPLMPSLLSPLAAVEPLVAGVFSLSEKALE